VRTPAAILAIETSNPSAWRDNDAWSPGVALGVVEGTGVRLLGVRASDPRDRDDPFLAHAAELLSAHGLHPSDLARVAVSSGPGGFTSVRVAVTAGKVIGLATGAALCLIPSAHVAARRIDHPSFAVALASKGDDAWVTPIRDGRPDQGRLVGARHLEGLSIGLLLADDHLPLPMREECARLGIVIERPTFDPVDLLHLSVHADTVDVHRATPLYPRQAEAVRKWRELHGDR
jgi:tRNA A37 threonylcarbamoyladenosine modification protein TsaB